MSERLPVWITDWEPGFGSSIHVEIENGGPRFLSETTRMTWYGQFQREYWRLFNVMVRVFGIAAMLAAITFMAWAVYFALVAEAYKGVASAELAASWFYAAVGGLPMLLGIAVLRTTPYRPDLGDPAWTPLRRDHASGSNVKRRGRSWWTGEPIPPR